MKTVEISAFGAPEVLRLAERPAPSAGVGELLIRVTASGTSTTVPLESANGLFAVKPNPRLGILAKLSSKVVGDVNFDGEADGLDLLACARAIGTKYKGTDAAPGLWDLDSHFPVACDRDDDGDIDENDWESIESAFGGSK